MKKARQRAGIDRGIRLIMLAKWRQAFERLRAVPGPPSAFKQLRELTERMHAGTDIEEAQQHLQKMALEQAAALANPREQSKRRAAAIKREIDARAAKLKQCGVSNPVEQARAEAAKRHGYASEQALKKWLRRNR